VVPFAIPPCAARFTRLDFVLLHQRGWMES
jgi:hypothetical protein